MKAWLQALRPYHWVKNVTVWAAPLFAFAFTWEAVWKGVWVYAVFCALASGFYLVNDVRDVARDRLHPQKKHRPIASGIISTKTALLSAFFLVGVALLGAFLLDLKVGGLVIGYAALQLGYNWGLKHQPILDLLILAAGFVLRALTGAVALQVPVSGWFVLCLGLLALFLGIEKRKAELSAMGGGGETRKVLQDYSLPALQRMESVVSACAIMAYALWTLEVSRSMLMLGTIPFVIYAIFRYQLLTEQGFGETPEVTLFKDAGMFLSALGWLISVLTIMAYEGA